MKKFIKLIILASLLLCFFLSSCKIEEKIEKVKDLDFTICLEEQLPKELLEIINQKKENPFKLTYRNTEYLYIIVGYGEQKSGGYSITIEDLFLADNAIYIDTNLIGASTEEIIQNTTSFPYIVVKCELYELPVVFN